MIKSCYIHIPFCNKICSYCDFCKLFYDKKLVNKYLDSLEKEILSKYKGEDLDTIYIGGGTPSSLSNEELERLFKILSILKKNDNTEYTIEGNFESTDIDKLKIYKKYNINRLSFGIESTNKDNLELLNRSLDKKQVEKIIKEAKELGFNNINVDLIYALPNENIEILKKDLDYIFSLNIEHISTYSLIIEDNTILKINNVENIDDEKDLDMYKLICTEMKKHNYDHYEISNFSIKGKESRHNTCYWNNEEYYGFGLGASSYINNERITNTRSINNYLDNNYLKEVESLTIEDKIEYEVILNLRKKEGISLSNFKNKYNIDFKSIYNYHSLLEKNLLVEKDNYLFIPEEKWYISNEIIVNLLRSEENE